MPDEAATPDAVDQTGDGDEAPAGQETVPVARFRNLQGANDRLRTELRGRDETIAAKEGEISRLQGDVGTLTVRVRDLLVAANPDAVPELIGGATVEEIEASVPRAKEAFARAREAARKELAAQSIGAGSPARSEQGVSPDSLSAVGKIAEGLRQMGK